MRPEGVKKNLVHRRPIQRANQAKNQFFGSGAQTKSDTPDRSHQGEHFLFSGRFCILNYLVVRAQKVIFDILKIAPSPTKNGP